MKANEIQQKIEQVRSLLVEIFDALTINNKNGNQMDFVTHPNLSIDNLVRNIDYINALYYQKQEENR